MNETRPYYEAVIELIRIGHWITDNVSSELKEYGITEPQFNVLRILKGAKGQPIAVQEILENMVQRSSNVTRIVDKLVAKGYADRRECPTNRRKMDITITDQGRALLRQLDRKVHAWHKPMLDNLSTRELQTLKRLLTKLKQRETK